MIVVSDTSPLSYLVLIEQIELLPELFDRVVVPPSVLRELRHVGAPGRVRVWAHQPPAWVEVFGPNSTPKIAALGVGELEALGLAVEIGANLVLIDERLASIAARSLGLKSTGTLGVLDLAAERGLIELPAELGLLRRTSFRCSEQLYADLLQRDSARRRP